MFAVQNSNGQFICSFSSKTDAEEFVSKIPNARLEIIPTDSTLKIELRYVELSSPQEYGCDTPEFTTYGSLFRCAINLRKFMSSSKNIFDEETKYYLRKCRLYINGRDYTSWWLDIVDKYIKYYEIHLCD